MLPPRSVTTATTWRSLPSLHWHHVSDRSPTPTTSSQTSSDGRPDPNIWLSTYYVTVKAAGGNFEHMAAYFPLVMGDALSLWLNNLPAGNIMSWADLSQAFTLNFQVTYNRPGNAFNLGRVTLKTDERLRLLTVKFRQPSHEFTFGVGISFISYPLVLTPVV
jgi:hypothetical protein